MHHYVCCAVVVLIRVADRFAPEKDAGVGVHGCLIWRDGAVELPHDDGFGVVEKVAADARDVFYDRDAKVFELCPGTNSREEEHAGGVNGAGAEDGFFFCAEGHAVAGLEGDVYTHDGVIGGIDAGDPGVCKDGKVRAMLVTSQDGVDVGNAGAAATAIVGVVGDGEKADAGLESARFSDFFVEVVNDGDFQSGRAGLDPIFAKLITVA